LRWPPPHRREGTSRPRSGYPDSIIAHAPETVANAIKPAGFPCHRVLPWFRPRQTWYALAQEPTRLLLPTHDRFLSGAILNEPAWRDSTR
jgi:hypothetical protein